MGLTLKIIQHVFRFTSKKHSYMIISPLYYNQTKPFCLQNNASYVKDSM